MEILIKNALEFLESGEDNLKKQRFNAAVSDFFKSIVIFCDYLIYRETRILPKNHNDRFKLLENYFADIYKKVANLFETYIKSYNLSSTKNQAENLRNYAYELKNIVQNKK
jgi:uncharacterized protein (UPF0332 family)